MARPAGGRRELRGILWRTPLAAARRGVKCEEKAGRRYGACIRSGTNKNQGVECREEALKREREREEKKRGYSHTATSATQPHPASASSARAGKFVAVGEHWVAMETDACCPSLLILILFHPPLPLNFSPVSCQPAARFTPAATAKQKKKKEKGKTSTLSTIPRTHSPSIWLILPMDCSRYDPRLRDGLVLAPRTRR